MRRRDGAVRSRRAMVYQLWHSALVVLRNTRREGLGNPYDVRWTVLDGMERDPSVPWIPLASTYYPSVAHRYITCSQQFLEYESCRSLRKPLSEFRVKEVSHSGYSTEIP